MVDPISKGAVSKEQEHNQVQKKQKTEEQKA
jgi:hypothetical protein